jgi:hypothetical protein
MNVKLIGAGIIALITLIAVVAGWNGLVGYNNFENYQIYTSPTGGVSVIDRPGYYFKAFGKVDTYPRAMEVEFTEKNGGAIRATFNDGGTADISSFMRIAFPNPRRNACWCISNSAPTRRTSPTPPAITLRTVSRRPGL